MTFEDGIELVPHVAAPLIGSVDGEQLFSEAVRLMQDDPARWNEDDLVVLRQVALGNLYFFLRYVAGYSGPYSQLKPDLHMEMANWRQGALEPGTWSAGFVPRATYKSSLWTHGAAAWELLRNPDIRIGIFSCILDRSLEFMHTVQRTFDNNELMGVLFPSHCVKRVRARDGRWNDMIAVMPNRSRNFPEPSLKAHTAGGSTQGIHVDLGVFDDIVGDSQLNSARSATAEMERISNWFSSSLRTLLISQRVSRVTLAATRYSVDDPYERIMGDALTHDGDWTELEAYYPAPAKAGRWRTYYRSALADGESIFPESYSVEFLKRLARDDHWTYVTQYVNNPHSTGTLDFAAYELRRATLLFKDGEGCVTLHRNGGVKVWPLSECDIVMGIDPAASEKRNSAKTSRSALAVVARTPDDEMVVLDTRRDYVKPSKLFDWVFGLNRKYVGRLRQVRIEAQGPFKMLGDVLRDEMKRRGDHFYLVPVPAMGDKVPTIKMGLEPFLKRDALYVIDESMAMVRLEFDIFPSSALDLLDALKIAIAGTHMAQSAWANEDEDDVKVGFGGRAVGAVGY